MSAIDDYWFVVNECWFVDDECLFVDDECWFVVDRHMVEDPVQEQCEGEGEGE